MKKLLFIMAVVGFFLLTSCGKKEVVNVIFETNGGSAVSTITEKSKLDFDNLPQSTKEGYTFVGWYIDSELTKDVKSNIPKNLKFTLYAKWSINSYNITFFSNGGNQTNSITSEYNSVVDLPTPTKENYIFLGWCLTNELTNPFTSFNMPSSDVTLYAKWEEITYRVTFNSNQGSQVQSQDVVINTTASIPTEPTKTGYSFVGWFSESDLINQFNFSTTITSDITLYAKWQINQYTITFISGAEISVTSITAEYNKDINAPDVPIRAGYSFIGWYKDEGLTISFEFNKMPGENITLYAKWEAQNATINFNTNGGSAIQSITAQIDSLITPPTPPTKTGYNFAGWYTNTGLTNAFDWKIPVGGITVYAKWVPKEFTITFDSLDGSTVSPITASYLSTITKPADPTKEGYIFDGWYTDINFTTLFIFDKMPSENIILYASWIDASGEMTIFRIKTKLPHTIVSTTGVVISELGDDYSGFYILDDTGQIFVHYDQSLVTIGEEISISGRYILFNGIPMLVNINQFDHLSQEEPIIPNEELSIEAINQIDESNLNNYAKFIKTTGILIYKDGFYYIQDGVNNIKLSHFSYTTSQLTLLNNLINEYVQVSILLHQFDNSTNSWIATYQFDSLQILEKTDSEKLAIIVDNITSIYNNNIYLPLDSLLIPSTDEYLWSSISYQAIGNNANLFDNDNKHFLDTTTDTSIDFEITITVGSETTTFTITVYLKSSVYTILEFINSTDDNYYTIIGTVTFVSNCSSISVISDETGSIYFENTDYLIGDKLKITAKKASYNYLMYIPSEKTQEIKILSSNNSFDNTPLQLTLEELTQIDYTDSTIYGKYIEIRGFLGVNEMEEYILYNDDYTVNILNGSDNAYYIIQNFVDLEVIIRGYLLYMDNEITFNFFGYRNQLLIPEYTDEELVNIIQKIFVNEYGDKVFNPYETFELLPYNKILGGDISWNFSSETQSLIDPTTNTFIDVLEAQPIQINIVIQKNQARLEFTYTTTLEPFTTCTGDELAYLESYTIAYIRGTVLYHNFYYTFVKSGDDIIKIYGDIPAFKGDIILVKVYTDFNEGSHSVYIDSDDFFFEVISRNNPYEIEAYEMTIDDFSQYRDIDNHFYNDYIEVSGQLKNVNGKLLLTNGQNEVWIEASDGYTKDRLKVYVEQIIKIKAYVKGYNTETKIWTLYYTGLDGEFDVISFTDEEKQNIVQNYVTQLYQETYYSEISYIDFETTHPFIDCNISYVATGENASYLDIYLGLIYEVNERTEVTIIVTVTVNNTINTFEIILTILPIEDITQEITSIADFKNSNGETLTIRGVVISVGSDNFLIQDETGRIFVETNIYQSNNNIGKLIEITGKISEYNGRLQVDKDYQSKIVGQNQIVIIDYPQTPLSNIVKQDFYDESQYGRSVSISGLVTMKLDENYRTHYYITDGYDEIVIDSNQEYNFYNYIGYEITIRGFIYGQRKNTIKDVWAINVLPSSYTLSDYTNEELIDIIGNGIVQSFDGNYYHSYTDFYFPTHHSLLYNANITYQVINTEDNIIDFNRHMIGAVSDDTQFTIKVTVTLNDISKDFFFTINVRGILSTTVDGLKDPNGNPYENISVFVQYFYGVDGTSYYIYDGKVYVLNDNYYYSYYIDEGDFVYLSGTKNVIDELGGFGYDIGMINANEYYEDYNIESYPIEISQIYNTNLELNDLTEKYLKVRGQLLYDDIMQMYYIKDGDYFLYIRTSQFEGYELMSYNTGNYYHFIDHLYNEVYLEVLFPNIIVRGDIYLVDYKITDTSLTYPELDMYEKVMKTKDSLERMYHLNTYNPNEFLWLPEYNDIYETTISWSTNSLLYEDNYFKWVDSRQEINFNITITYDNGINSYSTQTIITIYLEPPIISPIYEVLRGFKYETYIVKGIVQEFDSLNGDAWIYLKDDSGIILIDYYWEEIEIGDEIIVEGTNNLYYGAIPCLRTSYNGLIKVVSKNNLVSKVPTEMTLEEIQKLDYMHPDVHGQLVTVRGVVHQISNYRYVLESNGFKIEIDYTMVDPYNGRYILEQLINHEIEFTGYLLGLESYYYNSNWLVTFTGNPLDHRIITDV